jgi:hypothetical protein
MKFGSIRFLGAGSAMIVRAPVAEAFEAAAASLSESGAAASGGFTHIYGPERGHG